MCDVIEQIVLHFNQYLGGVNKKLSYERENESKFRCHQKTYLEYYSYNTEYLLR